MNYVGTRASDTNPLRSIPLLRPARAVFGWTPVEAARIVLQQIEQGLPVHRARLQQAHAMLGRANRCCYAGQRRMNQAAAMREINACRRALLNAHRKLDAARAEVERLERLENEPELPFEQPVPAPTGRRVLREDTGTFSAGTVCTVEPGARSGWCARIVRPNGTGTATHLPTEEAALAWVDAELAAPTLH